MSNTMNKEKLTAEEMACWIVRTIENNSPETAAIIIMEQYASQQPPTVSAEQEFLNYCKEARDKFCQFIGSFEWRNDLRTNVDDLLICFDQMKERLEPPVSEPVDAEGKSAGHMPLVDIEELLREFYTTNKENKGSGYGRRLLMQIINDVADAQREIFPPKNNP